MSAIDFLWNASQSDQIGELEDEVKKLKEDMETARAWIEYLTKEIEELKNETRNRAPN